MLVVYSAGAFACYEVGKYFDNRSNNDGENVIGNFDDCVVSGRSIIQVYPGICVNPNENVFVKNTP